MRGYITPSASIPSVENISPQSWVGIAVLWLGLAVVAGGAVYAVVWQRWQHQLRRFAAHAAIEQAQREKEAARLAALPPDEATVWLNYYKYARPNMDARGAHRVAMARYEQTLKARQTRREALEQQVLEAYADHVARMDFDGSADPAALRHSFRPTLRGVASDIGLLRETTHHEVREIIGDGEFLPPAPPTLTPPILTLPYPNIGPPPKGWDYD